MMYRYFTKSRTYRYIDILQDIVSTYNSTPHKSLNNIISKDVTKLIEADLWAYMYLNPANFKNRKKSTPFQFKLGDLVRVSYTNYTFKRSYNEQWSTEIFKIFERYRQQGINMYKVKDFLGTELSGNFYSSELQLVKKDKERLWDIEKVLKKKKVKGQMMYLVKFLGWNSKYNQWIPAKEVKNVSDVKAT
ncbi:hypothetical protein KUTeg_005702 [Tegillarca granosa]|uniref:Chromo domain-containing protein n=1 Tax=Tegillarca granosa TaxID=220873 RepID=A0ABQ9FJD9_TEGGR|nr:hypothetical protein KUTeg_005702 [Tegillarca granosa]